MLRQGSRIAVVAPGSAVVADTFDPGLAWLESCGWVPVPARHVRSRHRSLAGRAEERAADLNWALTAPDLDAVWFARGGYGTAQLMSSIDWSRVGRRPVIGFSDASVLLWGLARRGVESIHGPVLSTLGGGATCADEESRAVLQGLLLSGQDSLLAGEHFAGPRQAVEGRLIGGNLTVLASLAGTPEALRGAGSIVVLEDVTEAPYRIERSLCQMIDSGVFDGAVGVGLGEFIDCEAPAGAEYGVFDVLREHLARLGVPVVHQLPIGHGVRNHAFRYGAHAVLSTQGLHVTSTPRAP